MECRIGGMLKKQKKHLSFHTPGHKRAGWDVTELSYTDNLLSPTGVIARAQEDVAEILGARESFFLTDGSTSGVHAMLLALAAKGCRSVLVSPFSHQSVKNGCQLAGLAVVELPARRERGIPLQPTAEELEAGLESADALCLTSPDYYGNFPPLAAAKELCRRAGKPLVIDGAHGSHLHFSPEYAGNFADLWVDGVHKSLPALTQGAVVSAKTEEWAQALSESVPLVRTTSPSYPILASVEYAVKYPRNEKIERASRKLKEELRAYPNADWSKIVLPFGQYADAAQAYLEGRGIYPEFNDGNYLMFYLSPCTKEGDLKKLARAVKKIPRGEPDGGEPAAGERGEKTEWTPLSCAAGRTCARECGIFPPCLPLVRAGERVSKQAVERLARAKNTFGLKDGKICVYTEEE